MLTRPYGPDDEDAVIELFCELPDYVETPADRAILRLEHRTQLVVEDDGDLVAYGSALRPPWFDPGQLSVTVLVTADRWGRGIGTTLWYEILAIAEPRTVLNSSVAEGDERSLAIATHWGLSVFQTPILSVITFESRPEPGPLPDGYRIEQLDDVRNLGRDDLDRLLLAADTSPEAEETGAHGMEGFDGTPAPVMGVILHTDDEPVGLVFTLAEGDSGHVLMTAVHPDHRGRGLARTIKEEAHAAAYDLGVRRLTTSNETANTAIRRLNESMGYQRLSAVHRVRRVV